MGEHLTVGEEQRGIETQNHETWSSSAIGVTGHVVKPGDAFDCNDFGAIRSNRFQDEHGQRKTDCMNARSSKAEKTPACRDRAPA